MKTKLLLFALLLSGAGFSQSISLQPFATGFSEPVEIVNAGDSRLFVVEQGGRIKILNADKTVNPTVFLDISGLVTFGGEQGLLGLAFHPDYATNGYFYVDYVNTDGNTVIARYTRSAGNQNTADPSTALIMLTVEQPFDNHNGGCLRFGPDGYLYIAMGDGGSAGDPGNRAQNKNVLLGKLLRLDVNVPAPYIPAGNPFVGIDGADEIWAYGLRNPWKFSFSRINNDLWIADVGQGIWEEINKMSHTTAGVNYGWKCYEGNEEFNFSECSLVEMYTMPIAQYANNNTSRCSITGGYVYAGTTYPNMISKYFFADYCTGEIGILNPINNTIAWRPGQAGTTTFGEDINGELYVAAGNTIYSLKDTGTTGTNDFDADHFSVYPNPAKDEVFIDLKNIAATGMASIFDITGKQLVQQPIETQSTRIDTSMLQNGIYLLTVEVSGSKFNSKLVIN